MSIARPPRSSSSAGFSLIDITVAMGLLVIIAIIIQTTIDAATRAERRLSATRQASERGERLTYELLGSVGGSRKLFVADGVGEQYLAALELSLPLLPGARLPAIDKLSSLAPDATGVPYTGNVILFAQESDAVELVANAGTGSTRHVDLYRLACVYPTETGRKLIVDPPIQMARDLVVWRSVRFANLTQLQAIEDATERASVVADLVSRHDCVVAWDLSAVPDDAFFTLTVSGSIASTAQASVSIEEDPDSSDGGRLVYANVQLARTDATDFYRRALLTKDDPSDWSPDGFEVKIAGLSGSRKVWMHLVVESPNGKGVVGVQSSTVIAHPRDL
jgi:hypothetical protein